MAAERDIRIHRQLTAAQLPLSDALELGLLEIVRLNAPLGVGRSGIGAGTRAAGPEHAAVLAGALLPRGLQPTTR